MKILKSVILGLLFLAWADLVEAGQAGGDVQDFKKQVKTEKFEKHGNPWVKVTARETLLYVGPGKAASVEILTSTVMKGIRFISVRVDGEECARFQVRSLKPPLDLPPIRLAERKGIGSSSSSQSTNGVSSTTAKMSPLGDPKTYVVYEGSGSGCASRVEKRGKRDFYCVEVDGEVVYLAPIGLDREVDLEPDTEVTEDVARGIRAKVLARINEYRKTAKISPVVEDTTLSLGCRRHAEYLLTNEGRPEIQGGGAHREDPGLPGYSDEGHKAAERSVIWPLLVQGDFAYRVDGWMATPYHRPPLLHPLLTAVGIGFARGAPGKHSIVVDTGNVDFRVKPEGPVLYPVPDQADVPVQFSLGSDGEWPEPRDDPRHRAGYPITLQWPQLMWQPAEPKVRLLSNGQEVEFFLSFPEAPRRSVRPQPGVVWILPKEVLKAGTVYTVEFRCRQIGIEKTPEWSKTWSFTTAAMP